MPRSRRTVLLILLATATDLCWTLEQPSSSVAEFYPANHDAWRPYCRGTGLRSCVLSEGICRCQCSPQDSRHEPEFCKVRFHMGVHFSESPKPIYMYSNSSGIGLLHQGLYLWSRHRMHSRTVRRSKDHTGRVKYFGTPALRKTEQLRCTKPHLP